MMQIDRPLSKPAQAIIQSGVDNIYTRFLALVAAGRDSTPEEIHEIAQGRVWTGTQALDNGLIDEIGDLKDAIDVAAMLAGIQDYTVDYPRKEMTPFETLITEINNNVADFLGTVGLTPELKSIIPKTFHHYTNKIFDPIRMMETLNDPKGVYLYCEQCPS